MAAVLSSRDTRSVRSAWRVQRLHVDDPGGRGVDAAIEAVGVPATFMLCEDIVAPGGVIAMSACTVRRWNCIWSASGTGTSRLPRGFVDTVTTPMLLRTVQSQKVHPQQLITHRFKLDKILDAYQTFGSAAKTNALKVIIEA